MYLTFSKRKTGVYSPICLCLCERNSRVGKTALAYYNVKYLTDYFNKKGVIPKFYFIVDRIDLLIQAGREFKSRGLVVHKISSRDAFAKDIKSDSVIHNNSGKPEITVVNIQKFKDDPDVIKHNDYQVNIQRVFFLDEVHRSYNPKGSFLANLEQTDKNAIKIGLTGTPLILNKQQFQKSLEGVSKKFASKSIFGDYIHKYYYNLSIKDGYTLRLIREEIDTSYKLRMQKALDEIFQEKYSMLGTIETLMAAETGTNVSVLFLDQENKEDVVLIDASNLGTKVKEGKNQKTVLSPEDEDKIISTFKNKEQVDDFSVVLSYKDIEDKNYSFSAGQYFEVKIEYVDITHEEFETKLKGFENNLSTLFDESKTLEKDILRNLDGLKYE